MPPGVCESLPEACQSREAASKENSPAPTKPVVKWNCQPATNECAAEIWCRINQTHEPFCEIQSKQMPNEEYLIKLLSNK
jgi:hypothetical protein